jgi:CRP/FNR family cyclic AMP-dependent transcriptional regulator
MSAIAKSAKSAPSMRLLGSGASFRSDLLAMLENIDLLSDLSWRETEQLAGYMQAYQADPGCVIFREGETGDYLCLLVQGRVSICKQSDVGGPASVSMEGRGRSIGEMALVDGEPRSATCQAVEASTLLLLNRDAFLRLSEAHPLLGFKLVLRIARLMSRRLRSASGKLVDYLAH